MAKSKHEAPKTLLGHEHVREILGRAVQGEERPAQAYVFSGPESVGKRTIAFWLRRLLNCSGRVAVESGGRRRPEPCGTCRFCCRREGETLVDLVELTVQEKRVTIVVDQIRDLQRNEARFGSLEARWMVFLLPEAHRLTDQAANCLLKTLEEPVEGQVFILCTPSHAALLPTIRSRCQMIRFTPVATPRIEAWLRAEGVEAGRARLAAALSGGRPGMAWRLVDDDKTWKFRGSVLDFARQLSQANACDLLEMAEKLEPKGSTPDERRLNSLRTIELLESWFRDLTYSRNGMAESFLVNIDHTADLVAAARRYSGERILGALTALSEARVQQKRNANVKMLYGRLLLSLGADLR